MTSANEYNAAQLASGALTWTHITELVRAWQLSHAGLAVDGKAGAQTVASIDAAIRPAPFLHCPLPTLADGRRAAITSEFRPPDRPSHDGLDWFYAWRAGDKPDFVGDKGAAGKLADGSPKWVVPYGVCAIAAATGTVVLADPSATGYRVWVSHGALRTGYFHLLDLRVHVGDVVQIGTPLGLVGDNPIDTDARHLHFELSPVDVYQPMDPAPFLVQ